VPLRRTDVNTSRHRPGAAASGGRIAVCAVLAVIGVLAAAGAAFDLWLHTVSFGGPRDSELGLGDVVGHLLLAGVSLAVPIFAARVLLGRVPVWLAVTAIACAALLGVEVLGVR